MTVSRHAWITERDARRRSVFASAIILCGLAQILAAVIWLPRSAEPVAAFLSINALTLLIGASLLRGAKELITIDAERQTIVLETSGLFGARVTEVPFSNVADAITRYDGHGDDGNVRYYVAVRLKTGPELALFRGSYEGSRDRATVEARCDRILQLVPTDVADESPVI